MNINWKVRLKNKTWLLSMVAVIIAFVYQVLGLLDIVPTVTEDTVIGAASALLTLLAGIGVIADPTTAGIGDSEQAMTYTEPKKHTEQNE